jgi:uncharacterized protein (DUF486 family)
VARPITSDACGTKAAACFSKGLLLQGRNSELTQSPAPLLLNLHPSTHERTTSAMPFQLTSPYLMPIVLLICSNFFMTFAWYGHLRYKEVPLLAVILTSWAIALVEYAFAVPANRYGNAVYSPAQLKTMQEVITLLMFAGFSIFYLKEPIGWNHLVGFALISAGAFFIFQKW